MKDLLSSYEVEALVNGKPITEYPHQGTTYIEGRKGSEYALRVTNNTYSRILAVVSVDGLNVMTGKPASSKDSGYVIDAKSSVTIPGWRLDGKEAAKFTFSASDGSYSAASGQGESNVGIVGVKVFHEQHNFGIYKHTFMPRHDDGLRKSWPLFDDTPYYGSPTCGGFAGGMPTGGSASDILYGATSQSKGMMESQSTPRGFTPTSMSFASASTEPVQAPQVEETIGTAFGEATSFKTETVMFTRQDLAVATLLLRYDTRKNLERVGVKFTKPKKAKEPKSAPQAFPGDVGCKPPPNWSR